MADSPLLDVSLYRQAQRAAPPRRARPLRQSASLAADALEGSVANHLCRAPVRHGPLFLLVGIRVLLVLFEFLLFDLLPFSL